MKENEGMPEMAGILNLRAATIIDMTKCVNRVVKEINMATFKEVLRAKLPKPKVKVRNMYHYGNCPA